MTSTSIYTPITPTYLYIKQHSITKKKYYGKTTKTNPYTYNGSGPYWVRHIKKHGKEHIVTLWVSELYYDTSIVEVALQFSADNDIVNSKEWANLKPENGLDGAPSGVKHTEKAKANMRKPRSEEAKVNMRKSEETKAKLRKPQSEGFGAKQSANMTGKKRGPYKKSGELRKPHKQRSDKGKPRKPCSEETKVKMRKPRSKETKAKMSVSHKGKHKQQVTCPHCGKSGGEIVMKRWHFDKCKNLTYSW